MTQKIKWFKTVTRPANLLDISLILRGNRNLADLVGHSYSQGLIILKEGLGEYHVPEDELELQLNWLKQNPHRINLFTKEFWLRKEELDKEFERLEGALTDFEDLISDFERFFEIYSSYIVFATATRIVGYRDFVKEEIIDLGELRMIYKKEWTKFRQRFAQILMKHELFKDYYDLLTFLTHREFLNFLKEKRILAAARKRAQRKLLVYYLNQEDESVLIGKLAREFIKEQFSQNTIQAEKGIIKGQIACLGYAQGRVKVALVPSDIKETEKDFILVTSMTTPDFVPLLKSVKAIVTDEGGLTCHAAIISRELNIPCVTGTKIATQVLKDGDLVEVDANKGIVKRIDE